MHYASMSTLPLQMMRRADDGSIVAKAHGTGFLWRYKGKLFLITNWHNVTGLNADTGLMNGSFIPNCLQLSAKIEVEKNGSSRLIRNVPIGMDLYNSSGPIWIEHPQRRKIDCVAIEVEFAFPNLANVPINEHDFEPNLEAEVGMDCFILGYPELIEGVAQTPIWKRGSIASEPELDHEGKPLILVDTASKRGMSGSPVLIRHNGILMPGGKFSDDTQIGQMENFLGIYSGRVGSDNLGGQLGRVWKARVIQELLDHGQAGVDPVYAE